MWFSANARHAVFFPISVPAADFSRFSCPADLQAKPFHWSGASKIQVSPVCLGSEDRLNDHSNESDSAGRRDDQEVDLVRRAASGEVGAYEQLYRAHVGRVHALCLRMARNRGDAEELTQDVFVRAWEKLHLFRGESAFSTWLHRLAVNVVLGSMRKRSRWREIFASTPEPGALPEVPAIAPRTDDLDLERAIAGLPERARLVFWLHDVEGYKHAEVASVMGLAVGTSKAHLHRARGLLREVLRG